MKEHFAGLHIGESHISAAEMRRDNQGVLKLHRAGWIAHDPQSGPEDTARSIRRLWQESRIKTYALCTCLSSRSLILKYFDYPPLSDDELESALRLEAEEALQLPADQICSDWHMHPQAREAGPDQTKQGVLVAAPRKDVEHHLSIVRAARLYPVIMDVRCTAVANLLLTLRPPANGESICLLHISPASADMCIIYEGSFMYPRSFYSRSTTWEASASYLLSSIKDNMKYYQFSLRKPSVTRIVLTGHIQDPDPFAERIEKSIGLPVEMWSPTEGLALSKAAEARLRGNEHMGQALAACMGLAIRAAS